MTRSKSAQKPHRTRKGAREKSAREKRSGRRPDGDHAAPKKPTEGTLPRHKKVRIGTYFVLKGLLSRNQARRILKEQEQARGPIKPRFGSLAVKKGYISRRQAERGFLEMSRRETLGY